MSDYRNTEYQDSLVNVKEKKIVLKKKIHDEHSGSVNEYNYIHDKNYEYFSLFSDIYNKKCAYCGVSTYVIPLSFFEIDHYKNKKHADFNGDEIKAGKIENLRFSCRDCNRWKSSFPIDGPKEEKFNTDNGNICKLFERDSLCRINISSKFKKDSDVQEFFRNLKFSRKTRQLDYLIMRLDGYIKKGSIKLETKDFIRDILDELRSQRNDYLNND